jgi:thiamine-phosphate pyrophosphorylase
MLLYAITNRHQLAGADQFSALEGFVEAAARADVDYIQLREKDLNSRDLERLAMRCAERVREARKAGSRTKLLINSRTDIAIACGADGAHLRSRASGEISAADARAMFDCAGISHPVVAVSCHSLEDVLLAESEGADFAVFGPVFGKAEIAGVGLDAVRHVCSRKPSLMAVFALGGVTLQNAAPCMQAGAVGIAAIRLFQNDLGGAVVQLRSASA